VVSNKEVGKKGEDEAVSYLLAKGFEILERNFRFKRNEVDIIARLKNLLVFVEVKMRSSNLYGFPETFVSEAQAERILEAADEYQHKVNWNGDIRFDIISIEKAGKKLAITHIEDAFY
jgi:putative endonuclease